MDIHVYFLVLLSITMQAQEMLKLQEQLAGSDGEETHTNEQ